MTIRLLALAVVLSACRTAQPMSWPTLNRDFLADAGATFNFRLGVPTPLAIIRDGAVLFRRTPPRDFAADLYELDTRTGAIKTLATVADLLGTGEAAYPIDLKPSTLDFGNQLVGTPSLSSSVTVRNKGTRSAASST